MLQRLWKAGFKLIHPEKRTISLPNILGDREIEWSWVASEMPEGRGEALDFGSGGSYLGLIAARKGYNVTAIDLESFKRLYCHPKLHFIQGDIAKTELPKKHFDLIISCSTVEHVGLAGRYGVKENNPHGDFEAMAHLREAMKPDGVMLLTIPVGQDAIFPPLCRVYGEERLPRLIDGYSIEKEEYWMKDSQNRWQASSKEKALDFTAHMGSWDVHKDICALGCFVLKRS